MSDISPEERAEAIDDARQEAIILPPHTTREVRKAQVADYIIRARTALAAAASRTPESSSESQKPFVYSPPPTPEDLVGHGPTTTYTDAHGYTVTTLRDPRGPNQR